jgi:hypothetical protein
MAATSCIATLATYDAIKDLRVFLFSAALFNEKPPTIYLYCDTRVYDILSTFKYPGKIHARVALDRYSGLRRIQMEATDGETYGNLWFDFMAEKMNLLEWAVAEEGAETIRQRGIFFCDADICFLNKLPAVPPAAILALSPHDIRRGDEAKYGRYNGGFLWFSNPTVIEEWRGACEKSRFYEQSALEDVAALVKDAGEGMLYEFPRTTNYGWWRLFQGSKPAAELQMEWTMNRNKGGSGLLLLGQPVESIHTHFGEDRDRVTLAFNSWIMEWLRKLSGGHPPARRLHTFLMGI